MPLESLSKYGPEVEDALRSGEYEYEGLGDLRPGSDLHDDIVRRIMEYAQIGHDNNSMNIGELEDIERIRDGFMPADEVDDMRASDDYRKAKAINIVNPVLYSHEQQFGTAMMNAFYNPTAFHRYGGGGSPIRSAKASLATKLMAMMSGWFQERSRSDVHWCDSWAHGKSYMWGKWSKRTRPRKVRDVIDEDLSRVLGAMGVNHGVGDEVAFIDDEDEIAEEGTEWIPLDNFQVLPDTISPDRFQDSAFFGWVAETDALILYQQEQDPEEHLFNCAGLADLAKAGGATSSKWRDVGCRNERLRNQSRPSNTTRNTRCHTIYMFVRIIPRDWKLGESKKPQVWFFAVTGDRILIKCQPYKSLHGGLPVVACATNSRFHHFNPVSNMMINMGQQVAVDSLAKQDLDFQDLAGGGYFIIDDMMVHAGDFGRTGGPRIIRTKKRAMGKPIGDYFQQARVDNVTGANWDKIANLIALAEKGSGVTESAVDMPDHAGSQGINAIMNKSVTRMARIALRVDEQSRQQQARQNLCNAAQWMGSEYMLNILGNEDEIIRTAYGLPPGATGLLVGHWDIDTELDVVPLSSFSQGPQNVSAMVEFMKTLMASNPMAMAQFMARFRVEEFIAATARAMGIEDIDAFRYTVTQMPNEYVMQQQQAGNLVPMHQVQQMYGAAA